ncbi:RlpA-like double-psi beta-barrel domain-containing protein [Sporobolomyces salmoneus]|uniref:RlpA-like double-psi beta-barrel domain-containing protein n=1 Tax=Sporobolomyces salmoneus TaxID=183962 RepID=UPI00317C3F92
MLNPASLFVACVLTIAANPTLVSSIPLPHSPSSGSVLRRHSFLRSPPRKLPPLRIVDDEPTSESYSWTQILADETIKPESIFASQEDKLLNLELVSAHRSHHLRRDLPSPSRSSSSKKSGGAKTSRENAKRSLSETSHKHKNQKRFSSRWLAGQAAARSRSAEAAAAKTSSTSIVWTRVQTATRALSTPTSSPLSTITSTEATTTSSASTSEPTAESLAGVHAGEGTWFAPGLGACGTVATSSSAIVAVSHLLYDSYPGATLNPNLNPICGQKIRATYQGKTVEVEVQDRCEGCAMWNLDFSPDLFEGLADLSVGRLKGVEWSFI